MEIRKVKGKKNTYRKAYFREKHEMLAYTIYFTIIWAVVLAAQFI